MRYLNSLLDMRYLKTSLKLAADWAHYFCLIVDIILSVIILIYIYIHILGGNRQYPEVLDIHLSL